MPDAIAKEIARLSVRERSLIARALVERGVAGRLNGLVDRLFAALAYDLVAANLHEHDKLEALERELTE